MRIDHDAGPATAAELRGSSVRRDQRQDERGNHERHETAPRRET
jgi:hypothetical protein